MDPRASAVIRRRYPIVRNREPIHVERRAHRIRDHVGIDSHSHRSFHRCPPQPVHRRLHWRRDSASGRRADHLVWATGRGDDGPAGGGNRPVSDFRGQRQRVRRKQNSAHRLRRGYRALRLVRRHRGRSGQLRLSSGRTTQPVLGTRPIIWQFLTQVPRDSEPEVFRRAFWRCFLLGSQGPERGRTGPPGR